MKTIRLGIDPGHGGDKPGAIFDPDVTVQGDEIEEEDINLTVSLSLARRLRDMGHEVMLTRDRDVNIGLSDRQKMISRFRCQAFVSIHCNATENHKANGIEAFYRDDIDKPLAEAIQQNLAAMTGLSDRGCFQDTGQLGKRLTVLDDSPNTPACLIELGFIDSAKDRAYLIDNTETLAEIMAEAIHEWAQKEAV